MTDDDHPRSPEAQAFELEEYRALRGEMLLRIAIQNGAIALCQALFAAFAMAAAAIPRQAAALALAFLLVSGAAALQWCHQGVRQRNLKQALLAAERRAGHTAGWEATLPGMRPPDLLGSRWFVSTKGVFLGLQIAALAGALHLDPEAPWISAAGAAAVAGTAFFLLTNPKE